METREKSVDALLTDEELDAWEERARGPKDWAAEDVLRLIAEVRRLRAVQTRADEPAQIVRDPERCGGAPTLAGTRTAVHDVVSYAQRFQWDLARVRDEALPHLSLEQVRAAVAWYEKNMEEIEQILRRRREFYERLPEAPTGR